MTMAVVTRGPSSLFSSARQEAWSLSARSAVATRGPVSTISTRERQAVKVFNETFEYYSRLQQEGEIESFEPILLEPHGGELSGFYLLRGDRDKLARIRSSEEFERLTARAELIVGEPRDRGCLPD